MRARCVNGPYAGQTFEFPHPPMSLTKDWKWVGPLMWINHGTDKHCYQVVPNGWSYSSNFRLIYRDTF